MPGDRVMAMRVLLIEDNDELSVNVSEYLETRGMVVDTAGDGLTGLHLAVTEPFDAIVLDLGLPGVDGLDVCRRLRQDGGVQIPVLMLTARDTLDQKLAGFDAGADDYLVKPFALKELEARLLALVRRSLPRAGRGTFLTAGDLTFDVGRLEVRRAGRPVQLTPIGLRLLERLMRASGQVVSRRELEEAIWGDDPPDSDALRAHVHLLRAAIDKPFATPLLHTLHGIGYRLEAGHGVSS